MWFHFSKKLLASYRLNFDTLLNKFSSNKPRKSNRYLAPVVLESSICFRDIYIVCIRLSHQIKSRYTPFLLFLFILHNERLTCMAFCTLIKKEFTLKPQNEKTFSTYFVPILKSLIFMTLWKKWRYRNKTIFPFLNNITLVCTTHWLYIHLDTATAYI